MDNTDYGNIEGNLEIKTIREDNKTKIMIYGDPKGLASFAAVLELMSKQDQNKFKGMPDGERDHIHIYPKFQLSENSVETIIGRLDAKGTGEFPFNYINTNN